MMKTFIVSLMVVLGTLCLLAASPSEAAEKGPANDNRIVTAKNHRADNPCAAKNPCAVARPFREKAFKDKRQALAYGSKLWKDASLGTSNMSCSSCHANGANLRDRPFPRYVNMVGDVVTLDQMINYCMTHPMKSKPLHWNSKKLTALTAFAQRLASKRHRPKNPCAMREQHRMKNPCMMKNPCAAY